MEKRYWDTRSRQFRIGFKNSIAAINSGANWIDSTVLGMGRGPGIQKLRKF